MQHWPRGEVHAGAALASVPGGVQGRALRADRGDVPRDRARGRRQRVGDRAVRQGDDLPERSQRPGAPPVAQRP